MRFFQDNGRYTFNANSLSGDVTETLRKLAQPYIDAGFDIRDIGNVITMAAFDASVSISLEHFEDRRAQEEAARVATRLKPKQITKAVRKLLDEGKKIDAIILVRRNSDLGLREAKGHVDKIQTEWERIQQSREPR